MLTLPGWTCWVYWVYWVYSAVLWCLAADHCEYEASFRIGYGLKGKGRVMEANRYYPPLRRGVNQMFIGPYCLFGSIFLLGQDTCLHVFGWGRFMWIQYHWNSCQKSRSNVQVSPPYATLYTSLSMCHSCSVESGL